MNRRPIIAVDFDGTLVNFSFPDYGKIKPDAKACLLKLQKFCDLILWTCRFGKDLERIVSYLKFEGISFKAVNENVSYLPFETSKKIYADYYIDDRAGFDGDWEKVYEKVSSLKVEPFRVL